MTKIRIGILAVAMLSASPVFAADFVMKISSPAAPSENDTVIAWMNAFEKGVEASSQGAIDVQLFPSNQLGQIPATVEGVTMGTIEMTMPVVGFLTGLDPRFQVLDAGGLFDSEEHAARTLDDPAVKEMLSEFGKNAFVEPLVILTSGQATLVAKTPVTSAADLSGKKIRTGGATPLLNEPLKALGASPVALPLGEVLPALQTGTIDGANLNMQVLTGFKFADVATEATYLPGQFTVIGGIVSTDFMDRIGPELAQIVREEAQKAKAALASHYTNDRDVLDAAWTEAGGNIHVFDDAATQTYYDAVRPSVEGIVSADPQMKADYDTLTAAAEAARQ